VERRPPRRNRDPRRQRATPPGPSQRSQGHHERLVHASAIGREEPISSALRTRRRTNRATRQVSRQAQSLDPVQSP
jgi:hypothetical protein